MGPGESGKLSLSLPGTLKRGRYVLWIRRLETTVRGAAQGSVRVTRTIAMHA